MKYKYITSIVVIGFLFSVSIISILRPDYKESMQESRMLQQLPKKDTFEKDVYKRALLNGNLFKTWDKYFSDQIAGRGKMVNLYTVLQKSIGKRYINKVYLAEGGDYMEDLKAEKSDDNYIKSRADKFNELANKFSRSKFYAVNIPDKNYAYENKVPIKNYISEQSIYMPKIFGYMNDKIDKIDLTSKIRENNNNYYKTDHHLNMDGAYEVYKNLMLNISKDFPQVQGPKPKSEFDIKTYKNVYLGSYGRKILSILDKKDDIQVYHDKDFVNYKAYSDYGKARLYYEGEIKEDALNSDYAVYLGANHGLYKLYNNQSKNNLKIVMIGDSMDNPVVPLMAPHFKELYSYDLRYYKGNVIDDIEKIKPDIIMCIGLSSNFINDTGIFRWKK